MKPKFRKSKEHKFEKAEFTDNKIRMLYYHLPFQCVKCGLRVRKVPFDLGSCTKEDLTMDEEMIESIIT